MKKNTLKKLGPQFFFLRFRAWRFFVFGTEAHASMYTFTKKSTCLVKGVFLNTEESTFLVNGGIC